MRHGVRNIIVRGENGKVANEEADNNMLKRRDGYHLPHTSVW